MKSLFGVFSLVMGLISLTIFIVRLSRALPVVIGRVRELIVDAFSQPPAAIDPVAPTPPDGDSGSLEGEGYWADRERS